MLSLRTLGELQLSGPSGEILSRRRNDLAVLVVLADRSPAAVRRESLQAMFWGERPDERAKHSLRQVVLQLRRICPNALDVNPVSLRVLPEELRCDAREFVTAATAGQCREAIALWTGDFLVGCEGVGAEGFRTWLDVERARLRRLLATCYERTVASLDANGDVDGAVRYARAWAEQFAFDERPQQRYIELLCGVGRLTDAIGAHVNYIERLRAEMDDEPSEAWRLATERVLAEGGRTAAADASARVAAPRPAAPPDLVAPPVHARPSRAASSLRTTHVTARRRIAILSVVAALCMTIAVGVRLATARSRQPQTLAVGTITSNVALDSLNGFGTLLNINLARIPGLDLISERRMSEVAVGMRSDDLAAVARAAGAREIIEGVLTHRSDGTLRADLRRTDLATGKSRAAYTVEGAEFTQLADLLTEQVARDLNVPSPAVRREGTTSSLVAYRFYEQGLRAYHLNDLTAARRFLAAALSEDSTFAMAAFYMGLAVPGDSADPYFARALRHTQHTNERERLLISVAWGKRMADPRVAAWADTLVTRYPSEPDAHLVHGQVLMAGAAPLSALPHFRRVVAMDSTTGRTQPRCRACDGLAGMIEVYRMVDSLGAAERAARTWLRWQPRSVLAWAALSVALGESGRLAEAHAAVDSSMKYGSGSDPLWHAVWWFRAGDYASVDRACELAEQSQTPDVRLDVLWTRVISFRAQGRLRDALAAAREYRRYKGGLGRAGDADGLLEAVVLAENGEPRKAGLLFDSLATLTRAPFASRLGASRAWNWTHAAGAYALAGDTTMLERLEDSVRVNGAVASERHQRLHHYVHGLLLAARGKPADAAESFRKALWIRQQTHVRIYLELARALVAAGRPAEAIRPLIEGLKGPISAVGLYATPTELQELLAVAYERSGQPDSALAQYKAVARAWRNADPQFAARRATVAVRIAALSRAR